MDAHHELASRLSPSGSLCYPGSEGFDVSNLRFTEYERPTYTAVVQPGCIEDVVETVKYATERNIPFSPRAGHHAVTSTMRHLQNGILIDMRTLNGLIFDKEDQTVTVGGGVITDNFVKFIHSEGMEVSVMGVALGAGLGRLQGKYGFLHDNMVSCKLVLADGSVVVASEKENADLFWALRGAGHNFGIAIEATFRVHKQSNRGIHYTWDLEYELEQCDDVFSTLNEVTEIMPKDLAIFVLWMRKSTEGKQHMILVNLVWCGPEAEADPWIARFEAIKPVIHSGKVAVEWPELPWTTYKGYNKFLSMPEVWTVAPYKMMSAACVKKFDLETTREFFESVKAKNIEFAGKGTFGAMFECLPHHRVREVPDDATAFPWRTSSDHFLFLENANGNTYEAGRSGEFEKHLNGWKSRFIETSGYGELHQYVNYGNTTSTMKDPPEALYGEPWRLEKLRGLKRRYDPNNVFRWYQPLIE
ncbi:fad fmn-dependent oxygenase oxidase [Apiospora rasikravindrae]|uniref:Fad fmn-dependent oxygenase oxidase n=1 Tax=Apiospora rasikravindrae TaxID=990691 RepID=A0ABR1TY33_9PEZI